MYLFIVLFVTIFIGVVIRSTKPDNRFKAVIKKIEEEIKDSERKLKIENNSKAANSFYKTVIEINTKNKYHWLQIREDYTQLCEKYRHDKNKLKQLNTDWSNYVNLIEEKSRDNPDPNEEDWNQSTLANKRMDEIEKRLTEGLPKRKPVGVEEVKKAASEVLSILNDSI